MAPRFKDNVFESFCAEQWSLARDLTQRSDIAQLVPLRGDPPTAYVLLLSCLGLVRRGGEVRRGGPFVLEFHFAPDYLRAVPNPFEVVRWVLPQDVFHPNIGRGRNPGGPIGICVGTIKPGTSIVDLTMQAWEIVTWTKVNAREDDALARDVCPWARSNPDAYPVDRRPLFRAPLAIEAVPPAGVTPAPEVDR